MDLKPKLKIDSSEKETVVILAGNNTASAYSSDQSFINEMIKYAAENPGKVKIKTDDEYGTTFLIPSDWVKIKPKSVRNFTEEERKVRSERMRALASKKGNKNV